MEMPLAYLIYAKQTKSFGVSAFSLAGEFTETNVYTRPSFRSANLHNKRVAFPFSLADFVAPPLSTLITEPRL